MTDTFTTLGEAAERVVETLARGNVERYPITDRAAWLALRKRDVTASQVGALLGVHEYVTAYSMWALKSGLVDEDPDETPAMQRGRLLEPVALNLLREKHPSWTITEPRDYYRDPEVRLGATPDAFVRDPLRKGFGVLQIKNVEPSIFRRKWMLNGTAEPPLWIAAQAIVEAHLTGAAWAMVAPMRVGFGLDIDEIEIPLHAELIARIEQETVAFWRSVAMKQPPDPDLHRDAALIEELYAPSGETIDLIGDNLAIELVSERERLSAEQKSAKERLAEIKSELLLKLGDASAGRLADGRLITAKRVTRAGYTVKPSEFVDLRIRKAVNDQREPPH